MKSAILLKRRTRVRNIIDNLLYETLRGKRSYAVRAASPLGEGFTQQDRAFSTVHVFCRFHSTGIGDWGLGITGEQSPSQVFAGLPRSFIEKPHQKPGVPMVQLTLSMIT